MKTEELIKAKKHIEHVIGTIKHDGHLGTIQTDWILPDLENALVAIEGVGCFQTPTNFRLKNSKNTCCLIKKKRFKKS